MEQLSQRARRPHRTWPWLLAVLALTVLARLPALALPHFRGDEPVYLALASQLERAGLDSYSLRYQDVRVRPLPSEAAESFALMTIERGEARQGALIRYYASGGENYHDREVSGYSPLYPALLALSQATLGPGEYTVLGLRPEIETQARAAGDYVRVRSQLYQTAIRGDYPEARAVARLQLYAVLPSLLGSLLAVGATFWLGLRMGGRVELACLSALFLATAPVELLSAHLIQSDALATGFAALGLCVAHQALTATGRRACVFAALAGGTLGLGVLAKPHVALIGVAYGVSELLLGWRSGALRARAAPLLCFSIPAIAFSLPWVLWVGKTSIPYASKSSVYFDRGNFGGWILGRSWAIYPLNLLYYSPQLLLGAALTARPDVPRRPTPRAAGTLLCLVTLLLLCVVTWQYAGRESRYLLPAYPALAVLAALGCQRLLRLASRRLGPLVGRTLIAAPLALLLWRSLELGALACREGLTHWNAEALFGF